jgi:transposase
MEYYAGIDVSLESASLCVVDATGQIVREAKVASEPEVLIGWFRDLGLAVTRIGLEAGPLSQWLYAGMRDAGLAVELLETRHVRNAFKAMPVKTDRKDARGIAQLMRLGWFRPVHCKSLPAQEVRALLTARKLLQMKNHDVEMSLRGVLRGFGLKVGRTTPRTFAGRIRELVTGHVTLSTVAEALLSARGTLFEQCQKLEKRLRSLAREDGRARLLMTAPGVGTIVALTYAAAIDDPSRFRSSKAVGTHFRLTSKKYQSGETDVTGRISKIGDGGVRTALYEAANVILTRPGRALPWGAGRCAWLPVPACARQKSRSPASSPWCCTACWPTARASSPIKLRSLQPANRRRLQVRAVRETGPPRARSRRRNDGSGQADVISAGLCYCATLDWPTCSSSDPIRWRPSGVQGCTALSKR